MSTLIDTAEQIDISKYLAEAREKLASETPEEKARRLEAGRRMCERLLEAERAAGITGFY